MAHILEGEHFTVNHTNTFVDRETGVHSSTVEGRNKHIKAHMKSMGDSSGINADVFWKNLAEFVWKAWFSDGSGTMQFGMAFLSLYNVFGFVNSPVSEAPLPS